MSPSHFPEPTPRRRRGIVAGTALATAGVLVALGAPAAAAEAASGATAPVTVAAAGDTTIDILDVNDFHGRIESEGTAADKAAGAAKLAAVVQAQREANPNTIFASVGDNVGASTFTSFVQQDDPTIDVLNQMRLDVSAIGNHELDKGQDDLTGRIEDRADWPYISANIVKQGTTEPAFTPWSIVEKGGVKVGFIGATTEALIPGLVSPGGVEGLAMAPIVSSVNRYATELTDGDEANGEADVLVLLVHEGATTGALTDATGSGAFGQITAGVSSEVSAIVSAHTHATYDHSIPGPDGTPRPVIQAGSYGVAYGHLRMTVAADGTLTSITSSVKPVNTDPAKPADTTSVDAVTKTVADAKAVADVKGKEQLGTITGDLRRALQSDGKTENRGGESTLGNNIAEVQRWATERQGSQVAFMNPGGLRTDLVYASSGAGDPDGSVSYKEAALVQPFANTLVTEDMTGQQIKDALEQQWQPDGLERPFLKLGVSEGFAYTYDPSKGRGERITGMTLDGEPIALDETLKVTVNSFLSTGGDNFAAFAAGTNKADSGQVDLQAQADYFAAQDAVEPPMDQRAVGVTTTPEPDGGFQPGDEVTVDLSSLVFSNAGDQSGTVSVSAGGTELASAPIDTTVVDKYDEQGRASLTFTVPETGAATPGGPTTPTERARPAAAAVETSDEPLVVELPSGQRITLAVTVPVLVAPAPGEEPVPTPGTDPTDPTEPTVPTDPTDPATPTVPVATDPDGGLVAVPIAGGGIDDADADGGPLAYTGAEVAGPALAAVLLLLAGVTALVLARRKRAAHDATVHADR
ncbi:bifunctional metallophosphatase/5'-nucleotidase [Curtobacterium sp. MCJR17_055]|uniref:bifunctional metallophosphatase/5'-nucleotidase n=1 Tax=unclassified Curtobacterium TaxID=257496 RepID=UPI000D84C6A8|nr:MULTISPECIES: bifunctional UDP-sugar hydrolase/5'-nucleotidase [unclassified Curtobacterium]PYY33545.1 bifunctional metallophosphatase/5'-nucleotidase [Curtobacterium sp. MCBD17_029]PYY53381.1 bifunctional metallophosphatase/5'-nucleotidase [Curtobacterium sp. MCJR17_055]PYY57307.1 bifunctional metallophosphatase/5'-nucleotidase [Curtobacterium sp. MCPF17_015]